MIIGCINIIKYPKETDFYYGLKCIKGRGIVFPGGKWEVGETFDEAASRELKEETGITAFHQELIFHGMSVDLNYTYAFKTKIVTNEETIGKDLGSGEIGIFHKEEFLKSHFRAYYKIMFEFLRYEISNNLNWF